MSSPGYALTWLGQNTFHLETPGGKRFLIDPWLEGNPKTPESWRSVEALDGILLTHAHGDHSRDVVRLAKQLGCPVVCIFEAYLWLEKQGVKTGQPMSKGGSQTVAGVKITMTHAIHSSSFVDDGAIVYAGEPAGYVVRLENDVAIYFAGDTGPMLDMQLIRELYRPDVAVLPIGDLYTMGPYEAAHAVKWLGAARIVPCHWGTFPALTGTPAALRAELAKLGVTAEVIDTVPGEPIRG